MSDTSDPGDTTGAGDGPAAVVRRADDVEYEPVGAAEGMRKGVLVDESHGAPHFAIRRFTLDPGAEVPRHTNDVEHEQYVLDGEYVVGIGDEEHVVRAGDSLLIPAGTVHWYRNEGDEPGAFLCAVPNGDDSIDLVGDGNEDEDAGAAGE
ncbi:cupin domain-containing protein [Halobium salinum]|uniref:Cupin domain-containing protein n=1 Tax=Halobium salinum TaxID=1364940 RepID=A0ABD5PFZ5_9EURY|nr:cupin domain-containing protein [Halobium salinum]